MTASELERLERRRLRTPVEPAHRLPALQPTSEIEVMVDGDLAVLRYRSLIDIAVTGGEPGELECWHVDCYRRDGPGSGWQVQWSQATEISRP